jgi:hypothetical protein
MVKRKFAIVRGSDGLVLNTCVWDGQTLWLNDIAEGVVVECPDIVGPGWTVDGDLWLPPSPVPEVDQ